MTIKTLPALRLATVPHRGPYPNIGPAFQKLGQIAGAAGLFTRAPFPMMGIYKDDPRTTPAEELRSAAALPVSETEPMPAGLTEERTDGGRVAVFLHTGPYEGLSQAWANALAAFQASGERRRTAPSVEIYLNNPAQVKADELQTEIAIPIE
jgi:AraC family transcriptional regulator